MGLLAGNPHPKVAHHAMTVIQSLLTLPRDPDGNMDETPPFDKGVCKALLYDASVMGGLLSYSILHAGTAPQSDLDWLTIKVDLILRTISHAEPEYKFWTLVDFRLGPKT